MNESPHNSPGQRMSRALLAWLIFFSVIGLLILVADLMSPGSRRPWYWQQVLIAVLGASAAMCAWLVGRWSCNRHNFGRLLVGTAVFATLAAIFYLEEDWRGKRAWEQCKAELEASGLEMNWNKYLPPPIPDDQNFFTASTNILIRFKKAQSDAESERASHCSWFLISYGTNAFPIFANTKTNPLLVANIMVSPTAAVGVGQGGNSRVFSLNDPAAPADIRDSMQKNIGRSVEGSAGFKFSELQLSNLTPARVWLQADAQLSAANLENLIPRDLATNLGHLQIAATATKGVFDILLGDVHATPAADYLKWSDQFGTALEEVREALKRPGAIIPGDYFRPYQIPIPNFVMMRSVSQMLEQRAQCELLLGKPDQALRELTLIHDLCRILEKPPTGKPETLVEAMINVAITGLYVNAIASGLRWHSWQEPQLTALQAQLEGISLPPWVEEAFRDEVAASAQTLEISTPAELQRLLSRQASTNFWAKLTDPSFWLLNLVPRGWYHLNMVNAARLSQKNLGGFDLSNNLILPGPAEQHMLEIEAGLNHWSPWNQWALMSIPNSKKAIQNTAYNQTLVNEALIVCALERYQLAHGEYPTTLEALVPQFIAKLPHDIIGGQPLHYRRADAPTAQSSDAASGKFLLYSVGWNEKDDGGAAARTKNGTEDREQGDWVWRN